MKRLCKCGCGMDAPKYYDPKGIFKNYLRFIPEHRPGFLIEGKKRCHRCRVYHEKANFRDQTYCRECFKIKRDESILRIHGTRRNYWLKKRYGFGEEEFNRRVQAQGGLCVICRKRKATAVDHCHQSGKVRGILCEGCNSAIGVIGEIPGLNRAICYLKGNAVAIP